MGWGLGGYGRWWWQPYSRQCMLILFVHEAHGNVACPCMLVKQCTKALIQTSITDYLAPIGSLKTTSISWWYLPEELANKVLHEVALQEGSHMWFDWVGKGIVKSCRLVCCTWFNHLMHAEVPKIMFLKVRHTSPPCNIAYESAAL